jgi:hypothetical protein
MTKPSKEQAERLASSFVLADGEFLFSICFSVSLLLAPAVFSLLSLF